MAEEMNNTKKHVISLHVANKPGVLIRISLVFARRGYNIDSLVVSEANDPDFSMMNIVASGDEKTLGQILKQLNKLVDVIHAKDYSGKEILQREMALIKVDCPPEKRTEVLQIADVFNCEAVDLTDTTITIMVTGRSEKLDAVKKLFENYGIKEIVRTGKILMSRGDTFTS